MPCEFSSRNSRFRMFYKILTTKRLAVSRWSSCSMQNLQCI